MRSGQPLRCGYFGAHQQAEHAADKLKKEDNNEALTRFTVQQEAKEPSECLQQNHQRGDIAKNRDLNFPCRNEKQDGQSNPETDVNARIPWPPAPLRV